MQALYFVRWDEASTTQWHASTKPRSCGRSAPSLNPPTRRARARLLSALAAREILYERRQHFGAHIGHRQPIHSGSRGVRDVDPAHCPHRRRRHSRGSGTHEDIDVVVADLVHEGCTGSLIEVINATADERKALRLHV